MTHREFTAAVLPLHDDMHRMATAMTGSADDASDAVQDTMVKLWKARGSIPMRDGETTAYCLKALRSTCFTMLQRRRKHEGMSGTDPAADVRADTNLDMTDTQRILLKIIASLPENQRTVVRLITMEGCDTASAAKLTGLSEANIRQLLSRARRQMRSTFTLLNK